MRPVPNLGSGLTLSPKLYSASPLRARFITTALANGAQLEDVQMAAGHRMRLKLVGQGLCDAAV